MKLKATDTLHITAVKAGSILPGEHFEVEDGAGKALVDRGLAIEVKSEAAPKNKANGPAPSNKGAAKS